MKYIIRNTASTARNQTVIRLLFNSWPQLIWRLSKNDCTPGDLLRDWSTHKIPALRSRVAGNPSTPIDAVQRMKNDEVYSVAETARQACINRAASEEYSEWMRGKQ